MVDAVKFRHRAVMVNAVNHQAVVVVVVVAEEEAEEEEVEVEVVVVSVSKAAVNLREDWVAVREEQEVVSANKAVNHCYRSD